MPKRYYWLKISEHFFDDDNIKWLESQENGIEYVYFWIKLLLKCLKNKDSGEYGMLRFTERIPYDDNTLSKFTNTPIDTVRIAMKLFQELGMLEILENKTIYIEAVNKMIGKETDAADRMRKMRNKVENKLLRDDRNNVTPELRYKESDIDIEKDNNPDITEESIVDGFEIIIKTYQDLGLSFQLFKIEHHCKIYGFDAVAECLKAFAEVDLNIISKSPEAYFMGMLKNYVPGIKITPDHVIKQQETKEKLNKLKETGEKIKDNKLTPDQVSKYTDVIKGIAKNNGFINGDTKKPKDHPWVVKNNGRKDD